MSNQDARTAKTLEGILRENVSGDKFIAVDDNSANTSESFLITGNEEEDAIIPPDGAKVAIKGFVALGEGNSGKGYIKRENPENEEDVEEVLLPVYFSQFSKASSSGELNIELEVDEKVIIETTDRGSGSETFFGISYYFKAGD